MLTKDDLEQIAKVMDVRLDEKLAPMKRDLKSIKKTIDVMARLLDSEQMRQRKRIDKVEEHLGLPHPE